MSKFEPTTNLESILESIDCLNREKGENESESNESNELEEPEKTKKAKEWVVYLLEAAPSKQIYIGATVNLKQRLRKHNAEIVGGAKKTTARVKTGDTWRVICFVRGFPSWTEALKFEFVWQRWRRKQWTKRRAAATRHRDNFNSNFNSNEKHGKRTDNAINDMRDILESGYSSKTSIPFEEWDTPPAIHKLIDTAHNQ
jgi:predicted GIY-YIG superfamily endonuclease